jgi:hypothetical protein
MQGANRDSGCRSQEWWPGEKNECPNGTRKYRRVLPFLQILECLFDEREIAQALGLALATTH